MSKGFDYSKWDNIELSDDEDDVHPNIDKESWFRMKHRSRVEREENEDKDKANILKQMETANQRIKVLEHDLAKLATAADPDDSDDDDLDDKEGIQAEIKELKDQVAVYEAKLEEYAKHKKWNVDNMCQVTEERTIIHPDAGTQNFTKAGFVQPKDDVEPAVKPAKKATAETVSEKPAAAASTTKPAAAAKPAPAKPVVAGPAKPTAPTKAGPAKEPVDVGSFDTYPEFCDKYAETVELFMKIPDLAQSKDFLLKYADILLQENCSNYLLLASLEDELNGEREKMFRTARQSQIITNIAELAKTLNTHPGNVILPFFARMEQREHLEEFVKGCKAFQEKIIARAIVKKAEIDAERAKEAGGQDLQDVPLEQRLGPGGLDPLEVVDTLPPEMVAAFESRDVDQLKQVLMSLSPEDAEYHMKRCVDSGLWMAQS